MAEETTAKPRTAWSRILGADDAPSKHEERLTKIQERESTERVRLQEKGLTDRAAVTARATLAMGRAEARRVFWAENGLAFFVALVLIVGGILATGALTYNEWLKHTRPLAPSGCVESVELSEPRSTDKKCPGGGALDVTYLKDVEKFQTVCRCPKAAPDAGGP